MFENGNDGILKMLPKSSSAINGNGGGMLPKSSRVLPDSSQLRSGIKMGAEEYLSLSRMFSKSVDVFADRIQLVE